mgnify:CR=1 FL=1
MLIASVSKYKVISFDTDGNILKIAKSPLENYDFIKVEQKDVEPIVTGKHSMFEYSVEYDFIEKEYKLKHNAVLEQEKTVSNFLHNISKEPNPNADITIVRNKKEKQWELKINKEFENKLLQQNIKIDPTVGFYSVTQKDNPNILHHLLKFDNSCIIPFRYDFEFDNDEFSIYTLKKFDTYCYEEINE